MTKMDPKLTSLAFSVAAMFCSACNKDQATNPPEGDMAMGAKCYGVNECSGQSACDVPAGKVSSDAKGHSCSGQNECKGKGWVQMSAEECQAKGGEVL